MRSKGIPLIMHKYDSQTIDEFSKALIVLPSSAPQPRPRRAPPPIIAILPPAIPNPPSATAPPPR